MFMLKIVIEHYKKYLQCIGLYAAFLSFGFAFFSNTAFEITYIISLLCWLALGQFYDPRLKNLNFLWLLHFFLVLFSQFANNDVGYFFDIVKTLVKKYIMWFVFTGLLIGINKRRIRYGSISVFVLAFILALTVLLQAFHILPLECDLWNSPSCQSWGFGFFNPSITSHMLIVSFFLHLAFTQTMLRSKCKASLKTINLLVLALTFVTIFILGQRSCVLGLVMGVFVWGILSIKKLGIKPLLGTTIASILSGIVAYNLSSSLKRKLMKLMNGSDPVGVGCRLDIWKLNWFHFLKSPWFGNAEAVKFNCFNDKINHAHSIYLQQLVANGIFGAIAWLIFWIGVLSKLFCRPAYFACLVTFFISGLVDEWFFFFHIVQALLLFIALDLSSLPNRCSSK